uniref:Uncharacterized protein n=1 Tax=Anopheles darlingi TaxID=43151 RepID=A0A2M4DKH9_ANODA
MLHAAAAAAAAAPSNALVCVCVKCDSSASDTNTDRSSAPAVYVIHSAAAPLRGVIVSILILFFSARASPGRW